MKIACISDSPKLTSGFGNVANQIYKGFFEAGWDMNVFGMMDWEPDFNKKLPYSFWPTSVIDKMGYFESMNMVKVSKPDIVWVMTDPGNLLRYVVNLNKLKEQEGLDFKILAYPPVEGTPPSHNFIGVFNTIVENGGKVVLWSKAASDAVHKYGGIKLPYLHFGADHANFRQYDDKTRQRLRYLAGIDKKFVIGVVGINKRCKGFDTLIYTAEILKKQGNDNIIFYCHTDPDLPTMQGYNLLDLADKYDVSNMFLWKPTRNMVDRGNEFLGIDRETDLLEQIWDTKRPKTPDERKALWTEYGFIDILNCFDLYVDTSQVEGWGLPIGEAMACGVPVTIPNDDFVRKEVFAPGAHVYPSLPKHVWTTWHTGARLVGIDPQVVADTILALQHDSKFRNRLAIKGKKHISQLTWDKTRKGMVEHANGML